MKNKSVSDYVAATMDAVLKSPQHKSLFGTQYKFASDNNDAKSKKSKTEKCAKCKCRIDECECGDSSYLDDEFERMPRHDEFERMPRRGEMGEMEDEVFERMPRREMEDDTFEGDTVEDETIEINPNKRDVALYEEIHTDDDDDDDDTLGALASFDKAIKNLLTASAALDAANMENSSAVSLKLASLIVQAKKVKEKEQKAKAKAKSKSKKSNKSSKLTSADFKKMHKEDDDGKLTSANFKKMLAKKKANNLYLNRYFRKYAKEADTTDVSLTARPAANKIFGPDGANISKALAAGPGAKMQKLKVSGDITMGSPIFISAKRENNKWIISSLSLTKEISGDAANNKEIVDAVNAIEANYLKQLKVAIEAEFNRVDVLKDPELTTMTNIEVSGNKGSIGM